MPQISSEAEKWLDSLSVGVALFLNPDKNRAFFRGLVIDDVIVRKQCTHRHKTSLAAYSCGEKLMVAYRRMVYRGEGN